MSAWYIDSTTTPREDFREMANMLLERTPIVRGTWQAQDTNLATHELANVFLQYMVPETIEEWQHQCYDLAGDKEDTMEHLNLLWAEKHFQERISGMPLNPAPSHEDWPWHQGEAQKQHLIEGAKYDHTYPERFWPKQAGGDQDIWGNARWEMAGIRFSYGDYSDVLTQLADNTWTRQAYLPIFFPEDTGGGKRVPCSLGFHFIRNGTMLDCNYFMRSVDITRHLMNDIYMAGRLLQHTTQEVKERRPDRDDYLTPWTGQLTMTISNLHMFKEDSWRYPKK